MPFNKEKMIRLILDECQQVDEKCSGYRDQLVDAIAEIISLEKQNSVRNIKIQQEITKSCYKVGDYLLEKQGSSTSPQEDV